MIQQADIIAHIVHILMFTAAHVAFVYALYYRYKIMRKAQPDRKSVV